MTEANKWRLRAQIERPRQFPIDFGPVVIEFLAEHAE